MSSLYMKIKKYLKGLFITIFYVTAITYATILFMTMSGEIFRCILFGIIIVIILPILYSFIDWSFKEQ